MANPLNTLGYARMMELNRFEILNEAVGANKENKLAQLLSGRSGQGGFQWHWSQLEKEIVNKVNAGVLSGTYAVHYYSHPDQVMITVNWKVDPTTGKVSYSDASSAQPTQAQTAGNNSTMDAVARKIVQASVGTGTDERAIFNVFRDSIKSQQQFNELSSYFAGLKLNYSIVSGNFYGTLSDQDWAKMKSEGAAGKNADPAKSSLDYWIGQEMDESEVEQVNDLLARAGITNRFKSL